jgi:(5-formylfuran-3-yl)methyl phosphate synthase
MTGDAGASTRLLVSVRSAEEALIALAGGADIIDAKEPRRGALGAVAPQEISAIVRAVNGAAPVSATIGDCDCSEAPEQVRATAGLGTDYVKLGLFGRPKPETLAELEACSANGIRLIAVMFADRAPDMALVRPLAEAGFAGVMLDTAEKGRGLQAHMERHALAAFLAEAAEHGLLAGLAGSLREADAIDLLTLRPDVLGFRGALCAGGARADRLDGQRVAAMRRLIHEQFAPVA